MKSAAPTTDRSVESLLVEAADAFTDELNAGRGPTIDAYAARYPEIAMLIRQVFPALAVLEPPKQHADDPSASRERLGDYRLIRELGRGGMGIVYEAQELSLGRTVALKVLPFAAMLDEKQLTRFKNEARAAATLEHPHIVPIYGVGEDRGVHYYSMRLIRGQSLAEAIGQMQSSECGVRNGRKGTGDRKQATEKTELEPPSGPQPTANRQQLPHSAIDTVASALATERSSNSRAYFRRVAEIGRQIAEALDHAHTSGVVHRDVKPANILLDRQGKAWITDFGLARIATDASMTASGDLLGTLRYMSPEQARGDRTVDHRTDVYSLGVTLYELATHRPAFGGADRQEMLHQIAFKEPKTPRSIQPNVPRDLETILLKAISKYPQARYATAQKLAGDLKRFTEQRPISARRQSQVSRAVQWTRRNRTVASLLAFAVLLLTTLAVGGPLLALRQSRLATAMSGLAGANAELADTQSRLAEDRRLALYDSRIRVAQAAFDHGEYQQCLTILDGLKPNAEGERDLRNFEWRYLWANTNRMLEIAFIENWTDAYDVEYSPNGKLIAAGGFLGELRVLDVETGERLWPSEGAESLHVDSLNSVTFSADGTLLAAASADRTVTLWDVADQAMIQRLGPFAAPARTVAFSPSGSLLAISFTLPTVSASEEDRHEAVRVYRLERMNAGNSPDVLAVNKHLQLGTLEGSTKVTFSSDGKIAAGDSTGQVRLWDAQTGDLVGRLPSLGAGVTEVAFSPTRPSLLACAVEENGGESLGGYVALWDIEEPKLLQIMAGHAGGVGAVDFSRDGTRLATGGTDRIVRVWNVQTRKLLHRFAGHGAQVGAVTFSPDGAAIASSALDTTIRIWDLQKHQPTVYVQGPREAAQDLAVSPDNRFVAIAAWHEGVRLRRVDTGRIVWSALANTPVTWCVAFSPDGTTVASGGGDWHGSNGESPGVLNLWDAATGKHRRQSTWPSNDVRSVTFSPDGQYLALGTDIYVIVLDAVTGKECWKSTHARSNEIAWSPDGAWIASITPVPDEADFRTVKIWDAATGRLRRSIQASQRMIHAVAISPDSRFVAAGGSDFSVGIWDVQTGDLVRSLLGHTGHIRELAFTSDGRRIASGSTDQTVRLWNVETGAELLTLRESQAWVHGLAFTHDDATLITGEVTNGPGAGSPIRFYRTR